MIESFQVSIGDAVLDDLRDRIVRTRWPMDPNNDDWSYGTNAAVLHALTDYWRDGFDWRAQEAAINALPHFMTRIDNVPIHFIHVRSKEADAIPLIMSHGWPWTFWDLRRMIGPLTDPVAHGGTPADAFDVVIPSLPGFGFSAPLGDEKVNFVRTADLWVKLMERLGYPRFAAQAGDFGAFVTAQLGHKYADRLIGLHVHLAGPLNMISGNAPSREDYGPGEEGWFESNERFFATGSGYSRIQATRPQTLAYAMTDSPVGMAAWLLEKRREWSDCDGDVERSFTLDELLTSFTIYWANQSFASAIRFYAEASRNPWTPSHDRSPVVEAPTGIAIMAHDIVKLPRSWAERYYDLRRWTVIPKGGHFASAEAPEALTEELRAFFRPLR